MHACAYGRSNIREEYHTGGETYLRIREEYHTGTYLRIREEYM